MSVQNQTPFNSYTANGATTVFPFTFLLLEAGDLIVEVDGVVQSTGFTLAGVGAPVGGSVTFTVAPANGLKVLLKRVLTLQRLTDYQNNGDLLAATLNKDFDRIWQSMQQLQQNDIRALKLPFDTPTDQVIPEGAAARANKGVKFDGSGNLILSNFDPDGAQDDATAAAATATTQAGIATTQAGIATTQAGIATTQAGIATTKADEAAASAASIGFTITALQAQDKTAFTTAGASPAFTVTTAPAYGAYAANQRMRVKFHAAGTTGSNTLNRDGLGAKNLMRYNANGVKVPAVVPLNQLVDIEYDGTDMVILDSLPTTAVPVRQTVLSGPLDAFGFPSFLPATSGSLSLTSQNITSGIPLVATSANGFGTNGADDRIGSSTANLTWSGLTANTTNYLYVDISADGSLTTGSTTLAPNYQFGGTRSTTSGQATYNIQEGWMTVGNGSSAVATRRVFVGEAVTNASTVTSTVAYAYQGRYMSAATSMSVSTTYSFAHNLGVVPAQLDMDAWIRDTTNGNVLPYHVDSNVDQATTYNNYAMATSNTERNIFRVRTATVGIINYLDTSGTLRTVASGELTVRMKRGW
jgi:hypothetical protein